MHNLSKKFVLLLVLFCMIIAGIVDAATVGLRPGELSVVKQTRVTHANYNPSEIFYGIRNPWNRDLTRMMYHESGPAGNGIVWGFVQNLGNWTTAAEYEQTRKIVDRNFDLFMEWSVFPGEEHILYGAYKPTRMISSFNTNTGAITPIVSYDPGDGSDVSKPFIKGWTKDNKLVVDLELEVWDRGAYEIDLQAKTRRFWPSAWYPDQARWPDISHGHGDISPDWSMRVTYGERKLMRWPSEELIFNLPAFDSDNPSMHMSHVSWKTSNDWWITDSYGFNYYAGALRGELPTAPHIDTFGVYQCWSSDGKCKLLREHATAGSYFVNGVQVYNYQESLIATARLDGRQVIYTVTDGKYSEYDNKTYGVTPWGHPILFLLDLAPVGAVFPTPTPTPNASDSTPPIISNVAAAVSGSSVTISWNLNEPATGQVAYGTGVSYGMLSALEPSFTYSTHSQTISNLAANTLYHYKVMSKDQAGNLASSGDFTFTIGGAVSCANPTPIPSGFSSPCPVFSVSPQSGSLSQNFSVTLTPDASKTVWIFKTMYITEGSTWKSVTLPGTVQYTYWLQGQTTYNLQPTTLGLTVGTHYLASWDWTWDAAAQCYKGPGATACGGGQYRIQQISVQ